jgi:PAS domain-containing protein
MDIKTNSGALLDTISALKEENNDLKKEIQQSKSDRDSVHISHQEQSAYEESQIRSRTIFKTSKLGNRIISSDLKILQVNSAMVALLGYDIKDEIIGTRMVRVRGVRHSMK